MTGRLRNAVGSRTPSRRRRRPIANPHLQFRIERKHNTLPVVSDALQLPVYIPETDPGGLQEERVSPQHVILHCVRLDAKIPVPFPRKG